MWRLGRRKLSNGNEASEASVGEKTAVIVTASRRINERQGLNRGVGGRMAYQGEAQRRLVRQLSIGNEGARNLQAASSECDEWDES